MDGKKLKNIRFPVLVAVLAAMLLACAGYLIVHGSTYTAELINIKNDYLKDEDLSATSKNEDILAVDKIYHNDKHIICVDVHSVSPGDTELFVLLHTGEGTTPDDHQPVFVPCHVNFMGIVVQSDNLNFDGFLMMQYAILGGIALVLLVTGFTFIEGFFKARFSYSMVACGGVALFSLFLLVISPYDMQWMNTFRNFLCIGYDV